MPVVNRARDPNDDRLRRQTKKCILAKPDQLRIGVVKSGRAACDPQGMFSCADTEPASMVLVAVRHGSHLIRSTLPSGVERIRSFKRSCSPVVDLALEGCVRPPGLR